MPEQRTAIEEVDDRVATLMEKSPTLKTTAAMTLVFQADPGLYDEYRAQMLDLGSTLQGKQTLSEINSRLRILGGKPRELIALADHQRGPRPHTGNEAKSSPTTRTMEEIHRMVADAKKRNPKLDDVAARKQVFTLRPDLYHAYRRESTRTTRRGQ